MAWQEQVTWFFTVAVEYGRDIAVTACTARCALTEVGAGFNWQFDVVNGHGIPPVVGTVR